MRRTQTPVKKKTNPNGPQEPALVTNSSVVKTISSLYCNNNPHCTSSPEFLTYCRRLVVRSSIMMMKLKLSSHSVNLYPQSSFYCPSKTPLHIFSKNESFISLGNLLFSAYCSSIQDSIFFVPFCFNLIFFKEYFLFASKLESLLQLLM